MSSRYFLEVGYMGKPYSGFQVQENANTIQAEVQKAYKIYFRKDVEMTGSSRTDAGVHARSNFFHFDEDIVNETQLTEAVYHLNAILPSDIVIRKIELVVNNAHCRFDAKSRSYEYLLYNQKDPFLLDRGYYYPYPLDIKLLGEAALMVKQNQCFKGFSKKNTQVHHYDCKIMESEWLVDAHIWRYRITGNRFLRGMVRGLVGTMLKVGTGKMSLIEFEGLLQTEEIAKADFSTPAQGLTLMDVSYVDDRGIGF
jgi:tRNA pseudouridine38-40 synthase